MPLIESYIPSAPIRQFRSLVFDDSLEVILGAVEKDIQHQIDFNILKRFLESAKKGAKGRIALTNTLTIDLETQMIIVNGYRLNKTTLLTSSESDKMFSIHYEFESGKVITALEYLYHMYTTF